MSKEPLRLGFLASRAGTSMRAIVEAAHAGELNAEPRLLICNNAAAPALEFALAQGIEVRLIDYKALGEARADMEIAQALTASAVDLVILSGFLRKLGPETLAAFRGRILNVHPSLLPAYGGHGMYGRRVHEAVHAADERVSGASIHLVEEEYDTGAVLAQARIDLAPGDGPEEIERKVTGLEPRLFVETLKAMAAGAQTSGLPHQSPSPISDNVP